MTEKLPRGTGIKKGHGGRFFLSIVGNTVDRQLKKGYRNKESTKMGKGTEITMISKSLVPGSTHNLEIRYHLVPE